MTHNSEPLAATPQPQPDTTETPLITFDDFQNIQLKVAQIIHAEKIPDTDKLLKLTIQLGNEQRTLVAGIALSYLPENLINRYIIIVANLKPAKLRGVTSQGMLLAAKDENGLSLLTIDRPVTSGSSIG
ncbi:methionine--tRNA ligase subunit beta [bacterium]|nr:methionine--tRNA ligase subunit beta [bacterium]MCP5462077.1 methionine--tRNA ligase subunit beta [bacterium]